ncbi:MAG: T9SS type A sorting domain-containing protein [Bacteroidetes Order II. Incertae sedis bacterium]|nr:T9SS type A sorting domain-containing protein [Bacteroidetes Order II. bacterium]
MAPKMRYGKPQFRLKSTTFGGVTQISASIEEMFELPPDKPLILRPVFPNPFHQQATISFASPLGIATRLEIFDLLGRRIGPIRKKTGTGEEEPLV